MEAIKCKHEVHQIKQPVTAQYRVALAVVESLISDCDYAIGIISGQEHHDNHAQGQAAAYDAVLHNLGIWRDMLLNQ